MNYEQLLVESIKTVVDHSISETTYTTSFVGIVSEIKGLNAKVKIDNNVVNCYLLEHLSGQIDKGDVVVVQDLYNSGTHKYIFSKIGTSNGD